MQANKPACQGCNVPQHGLYQISEPTTAQQGVPVAWRYKTPTGWHVTTDADAAIRVNKHHPIEPLYAHPTPQGLDARDMSIWLLARRSYLGSHREAAEVCFGKLGAENWDRYTRLAEFFAAMAKQEKEPSASKVKQGGAAADAITEEGCAEIATNPIQRGLDAILSLAAQAKQGGA